MRLKVRAILGLCAVLFSLMAPAVEIYIEGGGTVSPDLTGKNLVAGRTYTVTAKPSPGYTFGHWNIDEYFASESPKLRVMILNGRFYVEDGTNYLYVGNFNTYIMAHFLPKAVIPGTYIGMSTDSFTTYSTFRISRGGSFSAKAFFDGKWHSFTGKFSADGMAHSTLRMNGRKAGVNIYFDTDSSHTG